MIKQVNLANSRGTINFCQLFNVVTSNHIRGLSIVSCFAIGDHFTGILRLSNMTSEVNTYNGKKANEARNSLTLVVGVFPDSTRHYVIFFRTRLRQIFSVFNNCTNKRNRTIHGHRQTNLFILSRGHGDMVRMNVTTVMTQIIRTLIGIVIHVIFLVLVKNFVQISNSVGNMVFISLSLVGTTTNSLTLIPLRVRNGITNSLNVKDVHTYTFLLFLLSVILIMPRRNMPTTIVPLRRPMTTTNIVVTNVFRFTKSGLVIRRVGTLKRLGVSAMIIFLSHLNQSVYSNRTTIRGLQGNNSINVLMFDTVLTLRHRDDRMVRYVRAFSNNGNAYIVFSFRVQHDGTMVNLLHVYRERRHYCLQDVRHSFDRLTVRVTKSRNRNTRVFIRVTRSTGNTNVRNMFLGIKHNINNNHDVRKRRNGINVNKVVLRLRQLTFHNCDLNRNTVMGSSVAKRYNVEQRVAIGVRNVTTTNLFIMRHTTRLTIRERRTKGLQSHTLKSVNVFRTMKGRRRIP